MVISMPRSIKVSVAVIFTLFAVIDLSAREEASSILTDIRYFSSVSPRFPGTKEEKKALTYIRSRVGSLNYREEALSNFEDAHSFSENLSVTIQGKRPDTLLIVVPLDQDPLSDADEGNFSLGVGLGILDRYGKTEPPLTLTVLFAGDEYIPSQGMRAQAERLFRGNSTGQRISEHSEHLGCIHYIRERDESIPLAVLYIGFHGIPATVSIESGTNGELAPSWLLRRCINSLEESGISFSLPGSETQLIRLKLDERPSGIEPFLFEGIPALGLSAKEYRDVFDETAQIAFDGFFGFLSSFLGANADGYPDEWDRHALFFRLNGHSLLIGETTYIAILLFVIGILIVYALFSSKRFFRYMRILGEHAWSLPLLYAVMFAYLFLSTKILEFLLDTRNFPLMYRYAPFEFFILKLSASVFLFGLTSRVFKVFRFSRRGSFYSAAALAFLVIDTIIVSFIDISLTYYLLWALVFSFLFSISPHRILKVICLIISPALIIKGIVDVVRLPAYGAVRIMLLSPFKGNLLAAFILLPFVLMLIRVMLMFRPRSKQGMRRAHRVVDIVLGLGTVSLFVYLFHFDPFSERGPQALGMKAPGAMPLYAETTVDYDSCLTETRIEGVAPLKTILAEGFGFSEFLHTEDRSVSFPRPGVPNILSVSTSSSRFLDRKTISVTVTSSGIIETLDAKLTSKAPYVVFDSQYPISRGLPGEASEFHIGAFPQLPFTFDFTTDSAFSGTLILDAKYWDVPFPLRVQGERIFVCRSVFAHRSVPLGSIED